jgi:hypothetical protein
MLQAEAREGDDMPEKKRQKKAGQDKGKKNQARRRGTRSQTGMPRNGRAKTMPT